jgi:hypothetical protein
VCIADSEGDVFELFVAAQHESSSTSWIVRACQNRALLEKPAKNGAHTLAGLLFAEAAASEVRFAYSIQVRGRKPKIACETRGRRQARTTREATVEVRATRVTLRPPQRAGRKLPPVTVNVVLVRERDPPAGEPVVEWLLLTNLPIDSPDEVRQIIGDYCVRWMIEVFFRTLKSGCRVEERRFETLTRQLNCLAVYLIIAWRTLYACRLARSHPDVGCEAIFEPEEWKAVCRVVRNQQPPATPPTLGEMVTMVAQLGGYVARRNSPPGPQTLWLGLQRAYDFALCWRLFGPEATKPPNV